jgi:hypothetical protein
MTSEHALSRYGKYEEQPNSILILEDTAFGELRVPSIGKVRHVLRHKKG